MLLYSNRYKFSVGEGFRYALSMIGPLQGLLDRPGITHEFCNRQAAEILRRDGYHSYAGQIADFMQELNRGALWADSDWKNVGHYFDPGTGHGLWRFSNAVSDFRRYYGQALAEQRRGRMTDAFFYLGAAAHLVQDLCVPHHAGSKILSGHREYETWVEKHRNDYQVGHGGVYIAVSRSPQELLVENAFEAAKCLPLVALDASWAYHDATSILLPRAQRTTAGLFQKFLAVTERSLRVA